MRTFGVFYYIYIPYCVFRLRKPLIKLGGFFYAVKRK